MVLLPPTPQKFTEMYHCQFTSSHPRWLAPFFFDSLIYDHGGDIVTQLVPIHCVSTPYPSLAAGTGPLNPRFSIETAFHNYPEILESSSPAVLF